ncbi:DUF2946 family protein [Brackiella oedipodis]|uniref:DUF2946 family protein n=1 Tax=Brackiella oedipodis TaxID=124225 RepID=UPI0006881B66|nr:DUF2946 family protein [Brackiella oedipodis]
MLNEYIISCEKTMDKEVIAALKKWPNVPAAYGWISLDGHGYWRFHPQGSAQARADCRGETIQNSQIQAFLSRNYTVDDDGQWYIQNGPQKVYVTLPYAPYILTLGDQAQDLRLHTGQTVTAISAWYLDSEGGFYAQTEAGAAMISEQDLDTVIEHLWVLDKATASPLQAAEPFGEKHLNACQQGQPLILSYDKKATLTGPFRCITTQERASVLGFCAQPKHK